MSRWSFQDICFEGRKCRALYILADRISSIPLGLYKIFGYLYSSLHLTCGMWFNMQIRFCFLNIQLWLKHMWSRVVDTRRRRITFSKIAKPISRITKSILEIWELIWIHFSSWWFQILSWKKKSTFCDTFLIFRLPRGRY